METTLLLPDALSEAADQLAKRLGISMSELYAAAIEEYVQARQGEGITEAPNRVYEDAPSSLESRIRAIQASLWRNGSIKWDGGKPKGMRGVVVRGEPVSETIIRDRR